MPNLYKKTSFIITSIVGAFLFCSAAQANPLDDLCKIKIPSGIYEGHFLQVLDDLHEESTNLLFRQKNGVTGCVRVPHSQWGGRAVIAYDSFVYQVPVTIRVGQFNTIDGITFSSVFQKEE